MSISPERYGLIPGLLPGFGVCRRRKTLQPLRAGSGLTIADRERLLQVRGGWVVHDGQTRPDMKRR
jgi:hypothetical protein